MGTVIIVKRTLKEVKNVETKYFVLRKTAHLVYGPLTTLIE